MLRTSVSLFAIFGLLSPLPAQEGRLEQVRRELEDQRPATERPAPPPAREHNGDSSWNADGTWGDGTEDPREQLASAGANLGLWAVFGTLFAAPALGVGDRGQWLYFPRYPYDRAYPGYLALDVDDSPEAAQRWGGVRPPRWWMARVSLEDGNDFDGLNRFGGQVLVDSACRLGIITTWDHFRERLDNGRRDETTIGDFNFTWRFAQSPNFLMRAGLGFRVLSDDHVTDAGFNFHYGAECFPRRPLVLTGAIDLGNLGDAFVFRGRATAGILWHGIEAFGGYDFLHIGDVNLHGPMIGVRWWF
jgi:hypothetical protein